MEEEVEDSARKPELHQSQVSLYCDCGMAYYHRYVKGLRRPPGVAAITGTATHRSVESNLRHKIHTGSLLEEETVTEIAAAAVNQLWDTEGAMLDEAEEEEAVRGQAVDSAVGLARLHHQELAPAIQPISVEKKFRLVLPDHPVDLVGTIDIEEPSAIRDTKTFGKSPTQNAVDRSVQLTMYSLAKSVSDGRNPGIYLDVLLKTKSPRAAVFRTQRGPSDYHALLDRVKVVTEAIEKGVFIPTNPDDWRCCPKWCGYFDICPFGQRRLVQG